MIWTKEFWMDTVERTLYTVGEALLGSIAATQMINQIDWEVAILTSLTAGLITVLKCIVKATGNKDEDIRNC